MNEPAVSVVGMSVEEGHQAFEAAAQRLVGMGREEALAALDRGEWGDADEEAWQELRMLAPFGRDPRPAAPDPAPPNPTWGTPAWWARRHA